MTCRYDKLAALILCLMCLHCIPPSLAELTTKKNMACEKKEDLVCFSRDEIAKILQYKEKCRSLIALCEKDKIRTSQVCEAKLAQERNLLMAELMACRQKHAASIKKQCPSCLLPWVLFALATGTAIALGVWGIVEKTK